MELFSYYVCKDDVLPKGHYIDVRRWKSRGVEIVSFLYNIEELKELQRHIEERPIRKTSWMVNCSSESQRLVVESNAFQDILFVDVVDVYRNITLKLLHGFNW